MTRLMGVTGDAYYKYLSRIDGKVNRENKIIDLAKEIRKPKPMTGFRKLHFEMKPKLKELGYKIGRDKFFEIMCERGLHIKRKKKGARTTYSNHEYTVAPNRIKELKVDRPNQVFVSDITYIRLTTGFIYFFLVTDLFSRKIKGYDLREDLKHDGATNALNMALKDIKDPTGIIHHSDRGCQYCCHDFLRELIRINKQWNDTQHDR